MISLLALLLSTVGLFLSAWIVIPAPTFFWLKFSVGAPEISPWLIGLNGIAILLAVAGKLQKASLVALGCGGLALALSLIPLAQIPGVSQQGTIALEKATGQSNPILPTQGQIRPHPFVLADVFRGISLPEVRHTSGIVFARPDQVPLNLEIYRPLQPGTYPAIVVLYGGAWQRGSSGDNAAANRYLAAQGYAVWAISYRHAPRYPYPAQVEDVRAALQFIQQHAGDYDTDPDRLVLLGRSAGAHLALLAAYTFSNPAIRGVVSYYGPIDLATAYARPPNPDPINTRQVLETFLGGTLNQLPEVYRQASPMHHITPDLPPTLLVYGSRDHLVEAKYGRQLGDRLQATDNPVMYLELPWADHAFDAVFSGPSHQIALYYTERFLPWAFQR